MARALLFVVLICALFAAITYSFTYIIDFVFKFRFRDYLGRDDKQNFMLIVVVAAFLIGYFVYYLIATRLATQITSLSPYRLLNQVVLALLCLGMVAYLVYNTWKYNLTYTTLVKVEATALTLGILALGYGIWDLIHQKHYRSKDRTEYRA